MVENTHVDFPAALSSRGLQVQHRDEKRWLAHRQASERRELEEQQQKRLKEVPPRTSPESWTSHSGITRRRVIRYVKGHRQMTDHGSRTDASG